MRGDGSRASFTAASRKSKLGEKRLALRRHTLKKTKSQNWRQASLLDFARGCFDVCKERAHRPEHCARSQSRYSRPPDSRRGAGQPNRSPRSIFLSRPVESRSSAPELSRRVAGWPVSGRAVAHARDRRTSLARASRQSKPTHPLRW